MRLGGQTMLLYDVGDPTRPRLLDRVLVSPSARSSIRPIPGNRALVPSFEWGVELVDLNTP